jgi:inorganic pyrophosphatase
MFSLVPTCKNPPEEINVIIENPMGGAPVKYEVDKETGVMFVDRFLHTPMYYPKWLHSANLVVMAPA